MGAAPTHAERTGSTRHRVGGAYAVAGDGGLGRVDRGVQAEVFAERPLGFEAPRATADETGVIETGHGDEDVEVGLPPRE